MTGSVARRVPRFVFLADADGRNHPGPRYGWRLVAANNRPLGRGRYAEATYQRCRESAQRAHDDAADADTSIQFDPDEGQWRWRMTLGGTTVAVCVHPYLRRVECLRGLAQFISAVQAADPDDGVIRYFGPRSLRAYEPAVAAER